MDESDFFDLDLELPNQELTKQADGLIGFDTRYLRVHSHLRMMLSPNDLEKWAANFHGEHSFLRDIVSQRHPIFVFSGDVGTGKTVTAQCIVNRLSHEMQREGRLLKLSTRVRGQGLHGQMSQLIHSAFEKLEEAAGKKRLGFLLIDEADALSSLRSTEQMHQEEKAAVNTLIQKLDDLRRKGGRAVAFLCTNRLDVIDPAVIRRTALHLNFTRPSAEERRQLLKRDLCRLNLSDSQIDDLVQRTGSGENHDIGYTYSDFRLRMFPDAISRVFPNRPLTYEILKQSITDVKPSPEIQ